MCTGGEKQQTAKEAGKRMWGVKTKTIPIIVGALGVTPHSMKENLEKILKNLKEETIQEIALCGTADILRKNQQQQHQRNSSIFPKDSVRNLE